MAKYVAYPDNDFWNVQGLEDAFYMTEGQAKAIAFALNALAEGRTLAHLGRYPGDYVAYSGPTEGI